MNVPALQNALRKVGRALQREASSRSLLFGGSFIRPARHNPRAPGPLRRRQWRPANPLGTSWDDVSECWEEFTSVRFPQTVACRNPSCGRGIRGRSVGGTWKMPGKPHWRLASRTITAVQTTPEVFIDACEKLGRNRRNDEESEQAHPRCREQDVLSGKYMLDL